MNKIAILADSNIYRNSTADRFASKLRSHVTLINTTRMSTLEARLEELSSDDHSILLIANLSNVMSDFGRGLEPDELESAVTKSVTEYVDMIVKSTAGKRKVLLSPPFFRSEPKWFVDYLLLAKDLLGKKCFEVSNITVLPEFRVSGVDLVEDGVHLLPDAGMRYIDHLVCCVQDVLQSTSASEHIKSSSSSGLFSTIAEPTNADILSCLQNVIMPRLDEISGVKIRMDLLERKFLTRVALDDVENARDREETDSLKNDQWRDRVVLSGYTSDDYPSKHSDRKSFLSSKFRGLIESIVGEIVYDVYPKSDSRSSSSKIPAFDIRFPTSRLCDQFKAQAFKKVKEPLFEDLSNVVFSHKLTLATRVRFEILRALSRKLSSDEESGYCPIHNPRPILQVGPLREGKVVPNITYTFVDAVCKYRHLISVKDLSFAYKRVGDAFSGSLQHTFIVLNEDDRAQPGRSVDSFLNSRGGRGGGGARGGVSQRGIKRKHESNSFGRGGRGGGGKRGK